MSDQRKPEPSPSRPPRPSAERRDGGKAPEPQHRPVVWRGWRGDDVVGDRHTD